MFSIFSCHRISTSYLLVKQFSSKLINEHEGMLLNVTSPHAYPLVICDNTVDETVCFGLFSTHVVITLGIHLDDAKRLAGIGRQMLIQPFPCGDDVIRYDLDICRLTLCSA